MFGWLRRNDGFEWHKYVRTTIKFRRDNRRRQIGEFGQAVASSGQSVLARAMAALRWPFMALHGALQGALLRRRPFGRSLLGDGVDRLTRSLSMPVVRLFAGIVGLAMAVSALASLIGGHVDLTARLTMIGAIVLLLAAIGPALATYVLLPVGRPVAGLTRRFSGLAQATSTGVTMAIGAAAVLLFSTAATLLTQAIAPTVTAPLSRLVTGSTGVIDGRGTAIGADMLRVGDTILRLADIEAPRLEEKCARAGSSGKARRPLIACTRAAFEALQDKVRGKPVSCVERGKDQSGRLTARCTAGGEDIAQGLVRDGYLRTGGGLFAAYGAEESAAKAARAGVWAGGEAGSGEARRKR